ncbi:MAG: ATP-grasp domain-containing protein [Gemmataceae bacterium]|nr:ATP-grasp domain-containing protein [Gemmataceae bacterium]
MKLTRVYVQAEGGVPATDPFYRAWDGFRKRGVRCEPFEPRQLDQGTLPLGRDTLVAGGVPVVEAALTALGVAIPSADNLPACLAQYRGRRVWTSTWGELRSRYGRSGPPEPLWVKSLRRHKGSPSLAVYEADDLAAAAALPDAHEVLVSEYVTFVSEWRCFVRQGRVLDLCRYAGEVFRYPDAGVVRAAVADYGRAAPAGYGIDFGVLTDGRTALVEVNEGYSLNPYGLEATEYAELLEARWLELAGG